MTRPREIPDMLHVSQSGLARRMQSDESPSQAGISPKGLSCSTLDARAHRCVAVTTFHLRWLEGIEDPSWEPVAVAIGCI